MAVRDGAKVPVVPSFKISRSAVNCLNLGENVHSCHRDWCKGAVVVMFHVSFSAAEQVVLPRLLTIVLLMAAVQRIWGLWHLGKSSGTEKGHSKDARRPPSPSSAALSCRRFFRVKCCLSASRKRSWRCCWEDACVSCLRRKICWAHLTNPEGFLGPLRFSQMCPLCPLFKYWIKNMLSF